MSLIIPDCDANDACAALSLFNAFKECERELLEKGTGVEVVRECTGAFDFHGHDYQIQIVVTRRPQDMMDVSHWHGAKEA